MEKTTFQMVVLDSPPKSLLAISERPFGCESTDEGKCRGCFVLPYTHRFFPLAPKKMKSTTSSLERARGDWRPDVAKAVNKIRQANLGDAMRLFAEAFNGTLAP
jgi:hypothetical protein